MIVIGDINFGKLFISFYYFLGKQAQNFGGNTMGHEKKTGILEERLRPGLTCTL